MGCCATILAVLLMRSCSPFLHCTACSKTAALQQESKVHEQMFPSVRQNPVMMSCVFSLVDQLSGSRLSVNPAPTLLVIAVQTMYKQSKKKFDEDSEFKERARKAVTKLQGGDEQFITAWKRICEASRKVSLWALQPCPATPHLHCPNPVFTHVQYNLGHTLSQYVWGAFILTYV